MFNLSGTLAAFLVIVGAVGGAQAAVGDWVEQDNARVRLVAAGVDANGRLDLGIEIELAPGWKTYWRTPGDAGVPPVTDFSASTNVAPEAEIDFPPPRRLDDGFAATNIYEDAATLPVRLKLIDPAKPVRLMLGLDIGVCEEVCIPSRFDLTLDVDPRESDPEAAEILAAARAKLPGAPEPGVFAAEGIARAGGTDRKPVFAFDIVAPEAGKAEVFIEGPVDWYPAPPVLASTEGNRARYTVEFSRTGSKIPIGGNEFRVTVVTPDRAMESKLTLH
jgi:DsbC/DsbD-like thiol-disulfide interchange protein